MGNSVLGILKLKNPIPRVQSRDHIPGKVNNESLCLYMVYKTQLIHTCELSARKFFSNVFEVGIRSRHWRIAPRKEV